MTATFHYITTQGKVEKVFKQGLNGGRKQARVWLDKTISKWEDRGFVLKQEDTYDVLLISGTESSTIKLELRD